ncbi:membrane-associating domain-containing protein [Xylariales sp. AK1849]|nr:membrane-associating domain-containing protein [Xylariales sp. AK1849]
MTSIIILALRGVQLVMAVVVLGLSAYIANWYNVDTMTKSPSQVNWLLFSSLWTIISVLYLELTPKFVPRASHPMASLGVEASNVLFYFAGFIALSVFISKLLFCRGTVCGAARADVAFGAIEFLVWTASAIFTAREVFKGGFNFRRQGGRQAPLVGPQMKEAQLA